MNERQLALRENDGGCGVKGRVVDGEKLFQFSHKRLSETDEDAPWTARAGIFARELETARRNNHQATYLVTKRMVFSTESYDTLSDANQLDRKNSLESLRAISSSLFIQFQPITVWQAPTHHILDQTRLASGRVILRLPRRRRRPFDLFSAKYKTNMKEPAKANKRAE